MDFPGFGHRPEMPSGDPILSAERAVAHGAQHVMDAITGDQKWALLAGNVERRVEDLTHDLLASLAKSAIQMLEQRFGAQVPSALTQSLGTRLAAAGQTPTPTAPISPPSTPNRPGPSADALREAQMDTPSAPEAYHPLDTYREARQNASRSMGGAARAALAPVARYMSEHNPDWQQEEMNGIKGWVRRGAPPPGSDPGTPGPIIDSIMETDPRYATMSRVIRAGAGARALVTGVASGDGIVGTLGATAARFAGPVGMAVGAVSAGGNFLENQNASAATYRSAFGEGGTGMFAAQDRAREWLAGLSGFGTIGGERARQEFQAASSMGLRGQSRSDATDFAKNMFMRFGMDTTESMQIVQTSIDQGNVSLKAFGEAITEVSRAAVAAGKSSKEAIDEFLATQKSVQQNVTPGGEASLAVATDIQKLGDSMDRTLYNSLGGSKGIAGLLTQQNLARLAPSMGQTLGTAITRLQNPATAEGEARLVLSSLGDQILSITARTMGWTPDHLRKALQAATGGKKLTTDQQYAEFIDMVGGENQAGVLNLVLQKVTAYYDLTIDQTQLLNLLFSLADGGLNAPAPTTSSSSSRSGSRAPSSQTGLAGAYGSAAQPGANMRYQRISASTARQEGLAAAYGGSGGASSAQRDLILRNLGFGGISGMSGANGEEEALSAYIDYVNSKGHGVKGLEGLLASGSASAITDISHTSLDDTKFRIRPGGGAAKDMTLAQIIKGGGSYINALQDASIVNSQSPNNNPTSISKVVVEFAGPAADWFRAQNGPTDEQRSGVPTSGDRPVTPYRAGAQ